LPGAILVEIAREFRTNESSSLKYPRGKSASSPMRLRCRAARVRLRIDSFGLCARRQRQRVRFIPFAPPLREQSRDCSISDAWRLARDEAVRLDLTVASPREEAFTADFGTAAARLVRPLLHCRCVKASNKIANDIMYQRILS
jgi:hypothetical protein